MTDSSLPMPDPSLPAPPWPLARTLLEPLPPETDVLVIGGGLAGCALAYYLAKEGVEVTLIERGDLNREASGHQRRQLPLPDRAAPADLVGCGRGPRAPARRGAPAGRGREHVVDARGRARRVDGRAHHRRPDGRRDARRAAAADRQAADRARRGPRDAACSSATSCARSRRTWPTISRAPSGAPPRATRTRSWPRRCSRCARPRRGASVRTQAGVTAVEAHDGPAGHRFTVTTTRGQIRAHRVVNAAGAWANDVAALSGLRFPMRAEGLHLNVSEPRAARARADGAAHRPPAHAEAVDQQHVHHRRRLACPPGARARAATRRPGTRRQATPRSPCA